MKDMDTFLITFMILIIFLIIILFAAMAREKRDTVQTEYDLMLEKARGDKLEEELKVKDSIMDDKRRTIEFQKYQINLLEKEINKIHGRAVK